MGTSSSTSRSTVVVRPGWWRRQWLQMVAWVEDHPGVALGVVGVGGAACLFYALQLRGFDNTADCFARWRVEKFGGVIRRDRSIQLADVAIRLRPRSFDRLDCLALGVNYLGINAFDMELTAVLADPGGRVRVIGLDPRVGRRSHPGHEGFREMAGAFGAEPWEFSARCWHAMAVLLRRQEQNGAAERVEIRLVSGPLPGAMAPYFDIGRSAQLFDSRNPGHRLDLLVARPQPPLGTDQLAHPGLIAVDRPNMAEVRRFGAAFEAAWAVAAPLDARMRAELLASLDGPVAAQD